MWLQTCRDLSTGENAILGDLWWNQLWLLLVGVVVVVTSYGSGQRGGGSNQLWQWLGK